MTFRSDLRDAWNAIRQEWRGVSRLEKIHMARILIAVVLDLGLGVMMMLALINTIAVMGVSLVFWDSPLAQWLNGLILIDVAGVFLAMFEGKFFGWPVAKLVTRPLLRPGEMAALEAQ